METNGWDESTVKRICDVYGVSVEYAVEILNKQVALREALERRYADSILPVLRRLADELASS